MKYYRITDGLNRVGKLIPETENPYNHIDDSKKDWYLSIYKYNEGHKAESVKIIQGKKGPRPKGVKGVTDVLTDKLVFDIDNEYDLESAQQSTIKVIKRLEKHNISNEDMLISFSGNKGFSIIVHLKNEITPQEHLNIAYALAGDTDGFDDSIYNPSRIFRLDYTKHKESGLFKLPLTFDQLKDWSVDKIKSHAKRKLKPKYNIKKVELNQSLKDLSKIPAAKKASTKDNIKELKMETIGPIEFNLDFSKKPSYLTDVKYILHKGYIPPGDGNRAMMILASTYKYIGMDRIDALQTLHGVNQKRGEIYGEQHMRTDEEIEEQVIDVVYNPAWKGGTYSLADTPFLQEIANRFNIVSTGNLRSIKQITDNFMKFAKNINKNVIRTGVQKLDDNILITTGMMVGILGAPGSGKTSFAISFVEHLSKKGQKVLFESLDMHENQIAHKLAQRVSGIEVEKRFRQTIEDDLSYDPSYSFYDDPEVLEAMEEVGNVYKNVQFNSRSGATIESIEKDILEAKYQYGDELKLVVVDYLEKVRGPFSDATANSGYIASRLADLARMHDVAILLLLQPQKSAGDCSEELLSMRKIKGASVIEQDCRVILTLWRPGFSPKTFDQDKYASIAIVKNNMGSLAQLDFAWNGLKGQLDTLRQHELESLQKLKEEKLEEKMEQKKSQGFSF